VTDRKLPPEATRFKKGVSGNPGGKAVGTRNGLSASFLKALSKDFEAHGESAIKDCREQDPSAYVRVIAGILPKQIEDLTDKRDLDELTDAELIDIIRGRSAPETQDSSPGSADVH
jgi:hypothetical protein